MMPRLLSKKVVAMIAAGAGSAAIATTFVAEKEGLSLSAYQDAARVWTICYGHTTGVTPGQTASPQECADLLTSELGHHLAVSYRLVTTPMTPARHAAIADFSYNLGEGSLRRSTLLRKLNAGDPAACDEILRWMYVGVRDCRDPTNDCAGIVTRRNQEAQLCRM